ncbi:MAG: MarR family winged helix-turn-helix transcriptional regulator [Acidimicrobiales bacterium]
MSPATDATAPADATAPTVQADGGRLALRAGLGFRLSRTARALRQSWAEELLPLALTPPQAAVLRGVAESPGCSLRALSRILGTDPTNAKRCVDELEGRGLLESRGRRGDRRPLLLHVSPAAEALVTQIDHLVTAQEQRLVGAIGPSGSEAVAVALTSLELHLGLDPDPGPEGDPDHDPEETT